MNSIYIKCLGDMSGYAPFKVHDENDWMTVMWNDKEHDLRIWWDDFKNQWRWAVYHGVFTWDTETDPEVACGYAEVAEDYEDQWCTRIYEGH